MNQLIFTSTYKISGVDIQMNVEVANAKDSSRKKSYKLSGKLTDFSCFESKLIHKIIELANQVSDFFIKQVIIKDLEEKKIFGGPKFSEKAFENYAKAVEWKYTQPVESLAYFREALKDFPKNPELLLEMGILSGIYMSNYDESLGYLLEAENIYKSRREEFTRNFVQLLYSIGVVNQKKGKLEIAQQYFFRARKLSEAMGFIGILYAEILNSAGNAFADRGNKERATEFYLSSKREYEKSNLTDSLFYAIALNNIAIIYLEKSPKTGIEYLNRANSIFVNENYTNQSGYAINLNNIGIYYFQNEEYDKAIQYYLHSKEIYEKISLDTSSSYADTLNNIASTYYYNENVDKSREYFEKAKLLYEKLNLQETWNYIAVCKNLGYIYFSKDPELSLEVLQSAKGNSEKMLQTSNLIYAQTVDKMGELFVNKNRKQEARQLFEKAYNLYQILKKDSDARNTLAKIKVIGQ